MQRSDETRDEVLIDLGSVTAETNGAPLGSFDSEGELRIGGISND